MKLVHKTDWLGSNSVYYSTVHGQFSSNFSELTSRLSSNFDKFGLIDYLRFGFSPYNSTAIESILRTPANSSLYLTALGKLILVQDEDPALEIIDTESTIEDVKKALTNWFEKFKSRSSSDTSIVLPLSGGMDSQLLGCFLKMHVGVENFQAFTYGISKKQIDSYENIYASEFAKYMDINHKFIELNSYHNYLDEHYKIYGLSIHAHSMYHMEFFQKINHALNLSNEKSISKTVISGAYGDVWAGSWDFPNEIKNPEQLKSLILNHAITWGDPTPGLVTPAQEEFFTNFKNYLLNPRYRVIAAARLKMILINHLRITPEWAGFQVESPFLDFNVASKMLCLPKEYRDKRIWQRILLQQYNPSYTQIFNQKVNADNFMDFERTKRQPPPVLLPEVFRNFRLPFELDVSSFESGVKLNILENITLFLTNYKSVMRSIPVAKIKANFAARYSRYTIIYPIYKFLLDRQRI
jgi:hypothetical protein